MSADRPADSVRIAMAQINVLVGDVRGNAARIIETAHRARDELGAHVVVYPELALTGYPPEDLLLREGFLLRSLEALERVRREVRGIHVVLGHPEQALGGVYNAASVLRDGELLGRYHKQHLPNYSVFDERRYFVAGDAPCVVDIHGIPMALTVCEDIWMPGAAGQAAEAGARVLLNLNASPYHAGKGDEREAVVRERVTETGLPMIYVNLVGGQDELVFDGESFAMDAEGVVTERAPACVEGLYPVDVLPGRPPHVVTGEVRPRNAREQSVYEALCLGVRDYVRKSGFQGAVLGLSGGVDSALTLAIAADALGPERVKAVMMPSRFTAQMSLDDAAEEARRLGVDYRVLPIEPAFGAFLSVLHDEFAGKPVDVTEENIQARCRGIILMAVSNKERRILLSTGNKSEMSVGYATLYGDMAGGFAPIKDVPKTLVYRLARYRNTLGAVIPERVLERPPSAELAADQKDSDSLPDYAVLDPILEAYVEHDLGVDEIAAQGHDRELVRRVARMVDSNEYKRRQAPPGVRITRRAFGRDRRYPIVSGFSRDD